MIKILKHFSLILLGTIVISETDFAQTKPDNGTNTIIANPMVSSLHTLSIHVRDTITHDSVFHFFIDKLKLPVYYYPVRYGQRKYAGIFTGNLVLEPCGPYSNFKYASNNFRAIFFGLTFETAKTTSNSQSGLVTRHIEHQVDGTDFIYLTDTLLCKNNITISLMDRSDKIKDKAKRDSLQASMIANVDNELGIENVKELWIGYTDEPNLQKWKDFIQPSELINNEVWKNGILPEIHFIKSNIKEVNGIVFEVKSLEKAKRYLLKNQLLGSIHDKKIELQKSQTYGLSIFLTEVDK
jgi:hypothetical protein